MILAINAILAAIAAIYAVRVDEPFLTLMAMLLLAAHALLLACDLRSFVEGTATWRAHTGLGIHADKVRQSSLERERLLEWEREFMRATGGRVVSDPLFRNLVSESGWQSIGVVGLFQRVLTYASRRFRAAELAVIFTADAGAISVAGLGVHGRRFEEVLKRRFRAFWSAYGPEISVPTMARDDTPMELHAFNISTALLLPFQWDMRGVRRRGLLWLGYSAVRLPSTIEEDLAQDLVIRIQDELSLSTRVQELRAQISDAQQQSRTTAELIFTTVTIPITPRPWLRLALCVTSRCCADWACPLRIPGRIWAIQFTVPGSDPPIQGSAAACTWPMKSSCKHWDGSEAGKQYLLSDATFAHLSALPLRSQMTSPRVKLPVGFQSIRMPGHRSASSAVRILVSKFPNDSA